MNEKISISSCLERSSKSYTPSWLSLQVLFFLVLGLGLAAEMIGILKLVREWAEYSEIYYLMFPLLLVMPVPLLQGIVGYRRMRRLLSQEDAGERALKLSSLSFLNIIIPAYVALLLALIGLGLQR